MKLQTTIAIWNVRTKLRKGQLDNIKQAIKIKKTNILDMWNAMKSNDLVLQKSSHNKIIHK